MPRSRPLLVGEVNPLSPDPRLALYPDPPGCAGANLCFRVLGFESARAYLRTFDRVNLCVGRWTLRVARERAAVISRDHEGPVILCGSRPCEAFGVPFVPFTVDTSRERGLYVLPHPSGRCRVWNDPGSAERARVLLRDFLPKARRP